MTPDQEKLLKDILPELTRSFDWMLTDIQKRADEIAPGSYSDDLQVALVIGDLLEKINIT